LTYRFYIHAVKLSVTLLTPPPPRPSDQSQTQQLLKCSVENYRDFHEI